MQSRLNAARREFIASWLANAPNGDLIDVSRISSVRDQSPEVPVARGEDAGRVALLGRHVLGGTQRR